MTHRPAMLLAALAILVACAVTAPTSRASRIAHWSFDGCSTFDSVAAHDLIAGGSPTCIAGARGTAWSLDGTSQFLERYSDPAFSPGSRAWSVTAWVRRSGAAVQPYAVVSWYRCGANPACTSIDAALWSLWDDFGRPYWYVRDSGAHDALVVDSTLDIADGQWHQLVGTLSAAHDSLKLYVDGVRRKALGATLGPIEGSPPVEVGRWYRTGWGLPDHYYPGAIDDVRIYDEELTPAAVAALYAAPPASVTAARATRLALAPIVPDPVRGGDLRISFTTTDARPVRVTLFDLLGRRVVERTLDATVSRPHAVSLGSARTLPPGMYLVRVAQGAESVQRQVIVLR